jgi:hypothetical protein
LYVFTWKASPINEDTGKEEQEQQEKEEKDVKLRKCKIDGIYLWYPVLIQASVSTE